MSCPFHKPKSSELPSPVPAEGLPTFDRLVTHGHDGRGADPFLKSLNSPDPQRVSALTSALESIINEWAASNHALSNTKTPSVLLSWQRFRKALNAISSTDFILQWNSERTLVERPGQRAHNRRGEISKVVSPIEASDGSFTWNIADVADRAQISRLMLLCLSGAPLEEANGLKDLGDTTKLLATRLAVLEKIDGMKLFREEDSLLLLEDISKFGDIERQVLEKNGLLRIVLVEGTRAPFYLPQVNHRYDTETVERILDMLKVTSPRTVPEDMLGDAILKVSDFEHAVLTVLMDSHKHHSDESFVIVRPSRDTVTVGDEIFAWAIVGGRPFSASAKVIQGEKELKVEIFENTKPLEMRRGPIMQRPWRRDLSTLDAFSEGTFDKIRQFRQNVISADLMDDDEYANDLGAQACLRDAAKRLFNRLLEHNLTASLNGRQQGATALQPGWHLSYDSNQDGSGYGTLNNPGHAMAGVQTMIRAPLYGSTFSHVRVWRERADWLSQYSLNDIRVFSAYHLLLDAILIAHYGQK